MVRAAVCTLAKLGGTGTIQPQPDCVVREISLNGLIGRTMWYRYNTPSADPCRTGTITPLADISWPMWIGLLSSQVACVVWEVPLKGLKASLYCRHIFICIIPRLWLIRSFSFEFGAIRRDKVSVHSSHDGDIHIGNNAYHPSPKGELQQLHYVFLYGFMHI